MNSNPKCLVAVPTFGRPNFIPRILACFKRLKCDNKKLVIINDDATMKYVLDDPEVDIINIDKHLPLAVKRNLFLSWEFDIMFPLDDDDLFLPDRMQNHIREYLEDPYLDLYRNQGMLCVLNNSLRHGWKSSFTNSSFTRTGFMKSGGYTSFDKSNDDDQVLRSNFMNNCVIKVECRSDTTDFIYQWQGVSNHNSFNNESVMEDSRRDRIIGDRLKSDIIIHKLHIDFDVYDNFVNLSKKALNDIENGIAIKLNQDGTSIEQI